MIFCIGYIVFNISTNDSLQTTWSYFRESSKFAADFQTSQVRCGNSMGPDKTALFHRLMGSHELVFMPNQNHHEDVEHGKHD
ncbi:MAG: hypothetical protein QOH31_2888 [Verrucomicrobiota bacterium]